jgi:hypothetical protein
MLREVREHAKPAWHQDILMFFDRELRSEELYVTFSYSPVFGEGGRVDGIHYACTEVTEKIVGAQQLETLRKLGLPVAAAGSVENACEEAVRVIGENPIGIPFAALYILPTGGTRARLVARVGIPDAVLSLPPEVSLNQDEVSSWRLASVLRSQEAVEIELAEDGAMVTLIVQDQGIGIDPEFLPRMFRPFERALGKEFRPGLGLGLFIAREVVQAHGGTIAAESNPAKGSTFVVRLPRETRPSPGQGAP